MLVTNYDKPEEGPGQRRGRAALRAGGLATGAALLTAAIAACSSGSPFSSTQRNQISDDLATLTSYSKVFLGADAAPFLGGPIPDASLGCVTVGNATAPGTKHDPAVTYHEEVDRDHESDMTCPKKSSHDPSLILVRVASNGHTYELTASNSGVEWELFRDIDSHGSQHISTGSVGYMEALMVDAENKKAPSQALIQEIVAAPLQ